jgi:antirestriction protein
MAKLELYANPYAGGKGFYFGDYEDFEEQYEESPHEEFEIDFIDGDESEQKLFKAMDVNQGNLEDYFDILDEHDEGEIDAIVIILEDINYGDLDYAREHAPDLAIYGEFDSDEDFAFEFVDSMGGVEALGEQAQSYFDFEAFGRDLRISGDLDDPDADEDEEQWWEDLDDQEIGEHVIDNWGGFEILSKAQQEMYFDWDKYARDLMFDMSKHGRIYYDPNSI